MYISVRLIYIYIYLSTAKSTFYFLQHNLLYCRYLTTQQKQHEILFLVYNDKKNILKYYCDIITVINRPLGYLSSARLFWKDHAVTLGISLKRTRHTPSLKSEEMILKVPISEVFFTCVPAQAQTS